MPKVGQKRFAYTPAGKKAASRYAKKKGKKVKKTVKELIPVGKSPSQTKSVVI